MKKFIFLVSLIIIFGSAARADDKTFSCLGSMPLDTTQYEEQLKIFEELPYGEKMSSEEKTALYRQTGRVLLETQALLSAQCIQYEKDPESQYILLLKIPESKEQFKAAHKLNQLAYSLYHRMQIKMDGKVIGKAFRIEINPLALKELNAGALFAGYDARLTLAHSNITTGQVNDSVAHEIRHAYNFYQFANGNDHSFAGWTRNSDKVASPRSPYDHGFSFDELATFAKQNLMEIKIAKKENSENPDFTVALDTANYGLSLSHALNQPQVLIQSLRAISELQQGSGNWSAPRWETQEFEGGEKREELVFDNKNIRSKVSIYKTLLFESINITHVVIENGEYTLEIHTRTPLQEKNLAPLFKKVSQKIADLKVRSEKIEVGFKNTVSALEKNNVDKALAAIRTAVAVVGIISN